MPLIGTAVHRQAASAGAAPAFARCRGGARKRPTRTALCQWRPFHPGAPGNVISWGRSDQTYVNRPEFYRKAPACSGGMQQRCPLCRWASRGHFYVNLTMNVYTDSALLDVAGAMEALPELSVSGEVQADADQVTQ